MAADATSRHPSPTTSVNTLSMDDQMEYALVAAIQREASEISSIPWSRIVEETAKDAHMGALLQIVENGFPEADSRHPICPSPSFPGKSTRCPPKYIVNGAMRACHRLLTRDYGFTYFGHRQLRLAKSYTAASEPPISLNARRRPTTRNDASSTADTSVTTTASDTADTSVASRIACASNGP